MTEVPARRLGAIGGYASLFASFGTLVCCALPSLLVLLGFGATVASALSAAPWLVELSRHKGWVFLGTGLVLLTGWKADALAARWGEACPPEQADACQKAHRASRALLVVSTALYATGAFVAFLLGPLLAWTAG